MVLVWLLLGVVVGAGSGPPGDGVIGVVAGVIAGVMILPLVGAALGLMGGRAREALFGAVLGVLAGALVGLAGEGAILPKVSTCLVAGALAGATFPGFYQLLTVGWRSVVGSGRS
jgi:hypothetical protein